MVTSMATLSDQKLKNEQIDTGGCSIQPIIKIKILFYFSLNCEKFFP